MSTTIDKFLDGRVHLMQPAQGYRAGADPVFLAASIPAQSGDLVLDVGTGVGAAMLCLAARVSSCKIVGLELQHELVQLARKNIEQNQFKDQVDILHGDLLVPPPRLAPSTFAHVMSNPPYFLPQASSPSPFATKTLSNMESSSSLKTWVDFCIRMTRPKGTVTFVYTADRLDALLQQVIGRLGQLTLFPLWPKTGRAAKRVLLRGRKNVEGPMVLSNGLVLHDESGAYSRAAQDVLRAGKYLDLL